MTGRLLAIRSTLVVLLVSVLLPITSGPAQADSQWIERKTSPLTSWSSVSVSADGSTILGVDVAQVCTSQTFGRQWKCLQPKDYADGMATALSQDGKIAAVATADGRVFVSTDYGSTWKFIQIKAGSIFVSLAMSYDGTKMTVVANGGHVYTTVDSGQSWVDRSPTTKRNWASVAMSKDGVIQYGALYGGGILKSKNGGVTWALLSRAASTYWKAIDCSADGKYIVATVDGGGIYTSANSGTKWTLQTNAPQYNWYAVAMSGDGKNVAAMADGADIFNSVDFGANWSASASPGATSWSWIDMSADGQRLVAGIKNGRLWTYSPLTPPTSPTLIKAVTGSKSVTLTFTAPVFDGDSAITGYEYSFSTNQEWKTLLAGSVIKPVVVSGLTNGTQYTVQIRAVNAIGPSLPSAPLTFTPKTVPDAPTIAETSLIGNRIRVTFLAPESDGGTPITTYEYQISGTTTWTKISIASGLQFDTPPFRYGTTAGISVRAGNSEGKGPKSAQKSVLVATIPSAPVIATVTPSRTKVVLTVNAPVSTGGAAITGYVYSISNGAWISVPLTSGTQSITISNLKANTTYSIRVAAINVMGQSPSSLVKNFKTLQ